MPNFRPERVSQLLGQQIGLMITQGEIKDPRVSSLVSVSNVTMSKDFAYAKVYISSFENHEKLQEAVDGLNHAAGFIQALMAKRVRLRNTARLTFIADHGIEDGIQINEKIKEVLP
jgi:ribosome-binding factor A